MEYKNNKLVVDELIYDPMYISSAVVVRIGADHYMINYSDTYNNVAGNVPIPETSLRQYKRKVNPGWRRATHPSEFWMAGTIPRDGYRVIVRRAATNAEFDAICAEYGLGENDISAPFKDTYGAIFGPESCVTVISRQVRVNPGDAIPLESKLRDMDIAASNGSPGRVNIRINLGDDLKTWRALAGLTQQQVADKAGIDIRQYQRFESGERAVSSASAAIVSAVAKALDATSEDLINNS